MTATGGRPSVTPARIEARYLARRAGDARVNARAATVRAGRALNAAQLQAWRRERGRRVDLSALQRAALVAHCGGELYGGSRRVWRELADLGLVTFEMRVAPGRTRFGWGTTAKVRLTAAGLAVVPLLDEVPAIPSGADAGPGSGRAGPGA